MKDVPVDLTAEWRAAPLGAVSWVLMGRDAGFRGTLNLRTHLLGTVGENAVESHLEMTQVRRTEFVPAHLMNVDLTCTVQASDLFHRLSSLLCASPSNASEGGLAVRGDVPSTSQPGAARGEATWKDVAAGGVLDALRLATPRIAPELRLGGTLAGHVACCDTGGSLQRGQVQMHAARFAIGDQAPFVDGDVGGEISGPPEAMRVTLHPIALQLGAPVPATLEMHLDRGGYGMHLTGQVLRSRLMQVAVALPQFGDGLEAALPPAATSESVEAPIRVDLVSTRTWAGGQSWSAATVRPQQGRRRTKGR
jgi:hypothetical protein